MTSIARTMAYMNIGLKLTVDLDWIKDQQRSHGKVM